MAIKIFKFVLNAFYVAYLAFRLALFQTILLSMPMVLQLER